MIGILGGLLLFLLLTPVTEAEQRAITLATVNWEPYYSEQLPDGGPVTEVTKEAFRQVGYEALIKFIPWKRAVELRKTCCTSAWSY